MNALLHEIDSYTLRKLVMTIWLTHSWCHYEALLSIMFVVKVACHILAGALQTVNFLIGRNSDNVTFSWATNCMQNSAAGRKVDAAVETYCFQFAQYSSLGAFVNPLSSSQWFHWLENRLSPTGHCFTLSCYVSSKSNEVTSKNTKKAMFEFTKKGVPIKSDDLQPQQGLEYKILDFSKQDMK